MELILRSRRLSELRPFLGILGFTGQIQCGRQIADLQRQVEAVFGVGGHLQCLLLESLFLEEMGDPSAMLLGNGGQHPVGRFKVAAHHGRLVLEHGEQQRERGDVQLLVAQIETVGGNWVFAFFI